MLSRFRKFLRNYPDSAYNSQACRDSAWVVFTLCYSFIALAALYGVRCLIVGG